LGGNYVNKEYCDMFLCKRKLRTTIEVFQGVHNDNDLENNALKRDFITLQICFMLKQTATIASYAKES